MHRVGNSNNYGFNNVEIISLSYKRRPKFGSPGLIWQLQPSLEILSLPSLGWWLPTSESPCIPRWLQRLQPSSVHFKPEEEEASVGGGGTKGCLLST